MSNEALGLPQISAIGVVSLEPGLLPDDTIRWDGTQWQIVQNDRVGVPLHLPGAPPAFNPAGPPPDVNAGYLYKKDGLPGLYWYPNGGPEINLLGGGGGGIPETGASTDHAIVRWGGVNGDALLDSGVTLTNSNEFFQGLKRIIAFGSATENTAVGADAIRNASGNRNTTVGYEAGFSHTTAADNTFVGHNAGNGITTAARSTAVGSAVLVAGNSADSVALGYNAMNAHVADQCTVIGSGALAGAGTASNSVAIGYHAMGDAALTGLSNTAVGFNAMRVLTSGASNTAVGNSALLANSTGSNHVAIGHNALAAMAAGTSNTSIGVDAGSTMVAGADNVIIGDGAMIASTSCNQNIAIGSDAMANIQGDQNVAIGKSAMGTSVAGSTPANNVVIGANSGTAMTTGASSNIVIGRTAGTTLQTGTNNVLLGDTANVDNAARSGAIVIGASTTSVAANNSFTVQSASVRNQTGPNLLYFDNTTGEISRAAVSGLDHGGLAGLADNDHPQYLLRDGTNAMTGNLNMGSQNITTAASIQVAAGAVTTPAVTFTGDTNTGIYSSTADTLDITTGGVNRFSFGTTASTTALPIRSAAGTVGSPVYSFTADTDTGIYSSTADTIDIATGGVNRFSFGTTASTTALPIRSAAGSVGTPVYSFTADTNTGIYSSAADTLNITTGGVNRLGVSTSAVTSTLPIVAPVGNYGSPGFQFGANSGIYKYSTDQIEIASGLAGDGDSAYLARFSPLGGWAQIRNNIGGLTRPNVFINQQYYGGNLTAGYGMLSLGDAATSTGVAWNHILCWNNGGNSFRVQGNGAVFADNAYSSSGADYAEYFESIDGKSIPIGSSVVLVDGKIRQATVADLTVNIIGVIRPRNSADIATLSNVFEDYWSGKYEKDEFGASIEEKFTAYNWSEDGKMISYHSDRIPAGVVVPETKSTVTSTRLKWSANYNPEDVYVPRSQRIEWHIVGILGQIPIKNGEMINPRWVLMGDIGDGSVAKKYLVR